MPRIRQPNAVKIAKGTQKCRLNRGEVTAPVGIGPPPETLSDEARKVWDRIVATAPPEVLTTADSIVVEQMAVVAVEIEETRKIIEVEGRMIAETRGPADSPYTIRKAHPLLGNLAILRKQFNDAANRFGLTAAARASIHIAPQAKPSRLAEFIAEMDDHHSASRRRNK